MNHLVIDSTSIFFIFFILIWMALTRVAARYAGRNHNDPRAASGRRPAPRDLEPSPGRKCDTASLLCGLSRGRAAPRHACRAPRHSICAAVLEWSGGVAAAAVALTRRTMLPLLDGWRP